MGSDVDRRQRAEGRYRLMPGILSARPGAREWFMTWPHRHHPGLVGRYERMYADGAYAPSWYQRRITRQVHEPAAEFGIGPARRGASRGISAAGESAPPGATQLTLL